MKIKIASRKPLDALLSSTPPLPVRRFFSQNSRIKFGQIATYTALLRHHMQPRRNLSAPLKTLILLAIPPIPTLAEGGGFEPFFLEKNTHALDEAQSIVI
jgi:hypothetical protein